MNKWNKKRIMASFIAAVLVFLMLISIMSGLFWLRAGAASSVDILREKLNDIEKKKQNIENELSDIKSDRKTIGRKKMLLDQQIEVAQDELDTTNELIAELNERISTKEAELKKEEDKEKAQYTLFKKRIRAMYETGETGYLEVLLSVDDFSSLLSRYEVISQIIDYDKKLIGELRDSIDKIEEAKALLLDDIKENVTLKASLINKSKMLQTKSDQSEQMMLELEKDEARFRKAYAEYEKEEAKIQKKIEAELAALKGTTYIGGDFVWPCPGYIRITSEFGWRFHPILRVNKLHTGTDIGAPSGARVIAANGGTVITSVYNSAYGNYIIIDHGGGKATLYAHLSKRSVQKGDKVNKSQQIGLVGSTGYSTGAHLHFEIRINGSPVNPMSYFKKS